MRESEKRSSRLARLEERVDEAIEAFWRRFQFWIYVAGGIALLLLVYFWPSILITVNSGEQGVLFRRFGQGTVIDTSYTEGLHIIPPWDTLYIYNVQVQRQPVIFNVLTKEGLEVTMELSVRYHPRIEQLPLLHKRVGPDYFDKIIRPAIISKLRTMTGSLTAEEIYSTAREKLQEELRESVPSGQALGESIEELNENYLTLDELLIERVSLPPSVREAIENKSRAHQLSIEYDFRLKTEEKEAERKRIEARGIRDFQEIIAKGISDQLLRWRGIEATLQLARSENAKVVVIGGGKDGLPLILDTSTHPNGLPLAPTATATSTPASTPIVEPAKSPARTVTDAQPTTAPVTVSSTTPPPPGDASAPAGPPLPVSRTQTP
ncbi:prohibitin family protein [Hyalangium versicolor]|uniref:prohibitin family protein n=1 Tax=Hyalangium versicolor TaxID=2861190 RepID=UPI001CCE185A|nr:prohibitin family protein [Hyalangium versicolor]